MPRKPVELSDIYPYHAMNRANNGDWFLLPPKKCWEIFCDYLYLIKMQYEVQIHLLILMSNHYHLLISTPHSNISRAIQRFQTEVAQAINQETNRKNHVFGGQYKCCIIKSDKYYSNVYKYLLRNPVKAGLCKSVDQYEFSSLNGLVGKSRLTHPICDPLWSSEVPDNVFDRTKWADVEFDADLEQKIKTGLNRSEFKISPNRTSRRKLDL